MSILQNLRYHKVDNFCGKSYGSESREKSVVMILMIMLVITQTLDGTGSQVVTQALDATQSQRSEPNSSFIFFRESSFICKAKCLKTCFHFGLRV